LLVLATAGALASIVAWIVALDEASDESDSGRAAFEVIAVLLIAVVPLLIATFVLLRGRIAVTHDSRVRTTGAVLLTALIILLGAFTIRSSMYLSYHRADTSLELLAQQTSPPSVLALVRQVNHLSRDLTLLDPTVEDPTGGHGISIALESDVDLPYLWYLREYPNLSIVEPGQGVGTGVDLVISRDSTGMDTSGYTHRISPSRNRVPPQYLTPSFNSVLESIFFPSRWSEGIDFLLFRQGITQPDPESVAVGYGQRLSQQLFTSTGPYAINERVGTGSGRGQFNQPRGVAINSGDGTIYVVDSANGRVQRFDAAGAFQGAWGGPDSGVTFEVTADGLGPTGIDVSFDGLILVADTWNHRIVVLNNDGQVAREFGSFGDTFDASEGSDLPGQFFGPRDIASTANEIYVVDTGNERVQVFAPDGTFIRSWGGYGSGPSQFIEPVGIAIGPDDRVYVADSGNGRISVFARDGTPLAQWPVNAWQGQTYFEPYLAFDQYGTLYATSSGTGTVEMYDVEGNYLGSIADAGSEQMESPIGIALAIDNTMRVSDRNVSAVMSIPIFPPAEPPLEDATPIAATPIGVASPAAEASPVADTGSPAAPLASPAASPRSSPVASPEGTPSP
ncbi:MAG: NHL repeat-containing protein, partial [Thermomicrobiales bacterium]